MANNVNANINVNIDTSDAINELRILQSQIASFNKALVTSNAAAMAAQKSMVNTLVSQIGATHQFATSITNVETSVSRLGKSIDKNKLSLGEYFRYGIAASGRFGRVFSQQQKEVVDLATDRVKRLQTQYIALGQAQGGMTKALSVRPLQLFNADSAIAIQRAQLFNKLLHDGSTSLINWGKNTQWAGRQLMVGFTIPLTIFGGMAGKIFMDLEKQIVKFRRVYGDATTPLEETDAMIGQIQELAKEYTKYGIAVSDTIALAGDAAAAGAQGESLIAATSEATRLGTLGMIDQQQALTATIALQSAFRMSNEELANSVNFLNAVENQTVVSLSDITEAIPLVAPVIQGLGGNIQDLAMFMAAMREGGVSASEGANALKSGLASLINPSKAAREQLSAVGINIDSILSKNKGDLRGIVTEFGAALGTLDKFQRQQVLAKMFGKYQFARLGALFDNINRSGSQAQRVLGLTSMSVEELGALADKELNAISESVGVKFTSALEKFKLAIAPIGETFLRIATPIIEFGTKLAEKFNELSPTAKQFTVILITAFGVIIPTLVMVTGLFANFFGQIIKGLATLKNFFSKITGGGNALKYLTEEELDAAAASSTLEGKVDSLTTSLNVQRAAVRNLTRAYQGYVSGAQAAAINLPAGAIRTPRPRRMATGGFVAGKGNKDTEPALLTPGEFVVNKDAAKKFGPILGAMNNGTIKQLAEGTRTQRRSGRQQVAVPGAFQSAHFSLSRELSVDELMALLPNVSQSVQESIKQSIAAGKTVLGYTNEVVQVSDTLNAALNKNMANVGMIRQDLITNAKFSHQEFVMQLQKAGATPAQIDQAIEDITNHIARQLSGIADDIVVTERQFARIVSDAYDTVALAGDNAVLAARSEMANITTIGDPTGREKGQRIALTGRSSYRQKRESYKSRMVATSQATGMEIPYGLMGAFNIAPMAARLRIDAEVMADIWKELSVETRAYLATIKSDITRFNQEFVREAERLGISIGDALNLGASTAVGANSPATDGIRLVDNYVDGMEIGAAQNIGEARAAGMQVRTAFNQGTMAAGPITQSGMTFLPSPMGLFLPEGAGDEPDKPINEPDKPADYDNDTTKKIDDAGKAADDTDKRVGKLGKTLGSVGKGLGAFGMIASIATGGLMLMDGKVGEIAQSLFPLMSMLDIGFIAMSMFGGSAGGAAGALGGLGAAAAAAAGPIALIVAAIVALIGTFVLAYKKFQFLRDAIADLGTAFKELGDTILKPIIDNFGSIEQAVGAVAAVFSSAFGKALEMAGIYFTAIAKTAEISIKIFTMFIGVINIVRTVVFGFIKRLIEMRDNLGPVGKIVLAMVAPFIILINVVKKLPSIFKKTFDFIKTFMVERINAVITVINMLIDTYNKLAERFDQPVIARIDYVITTTGTAPKGAPGYKPKYNSEGYDQYRPMTTPTEPTDEEIINTGGGGGEPQLTWLQEMMKEWEANTQLFLGKMKGFNTSFFGLVEQLRTGMRPGGKKTTPLPVAILEMIGTGPEGLARAQELLNLSGKQLKNVINKWRDQMIGGIVASLRQKKAELDQQKQAESILSSFGFSKSQVKNISADSSTVVAIVEAAGKKGKKAKKDLAELMKLLKEINAEDIDVISQAEKALDIMRREFQLRPDIRIHKELIKDYERQIELIQEKIDKLEKANEVDRLTIRSLERQKEMIQRQIDAIERQNELDQRRADVLKREDEIRNRVANTLNHELEIMGQQEQKIKEVYDQRVKALEKVRSINEQITQQQQDQLNITRSLASGDIYEATAAAQQMKQNQINFAQQQTGQAIQQGMENQVAGLRTEGGLTREQAEAQIASIKEQSYQTSLQIQNIEDGIYQRNLQIIPLKDAIYNLDLSIQKVNDDIYNRETEILNIKSQQLDPVAQRLADEQKILKVKEDEFEAMADAYQAEIEQMKLTKDINEASGAVLDTWRGIAQAIADANKVMKEQLTVLSMAKPERGKFESTTDYDAALARYEEARAAIISRRNARVAELMAMGANTTKTAFNGIGAYAGGYMKNRYATGNYVLGNGARDSVPAMLTPGEFVIRRAAVDKYGIPMLNSLNMGALQMPKLNTPKYNIPNMSTGANARFSQPSNIQMDAPVYNNYSVNVNVSGTNASADEIATKAIMKIKEMQNMQIRGNRAY